jgi:hypothetical protein
VLLDHGWAQASASVRADGPLPGNHEANLALMSPHSMAVAEFWAGDRGGNGRRGSAMRPSCISVRPTATLPPHCDTESALRPQARVSAAAAPAHGSNPTTPAAGSRALVIQRSGATRGMPFAEPWIGAEGVVRLRTALDTLRQPGCGLRQGSGRFWRHPMSRACEGPACAGCGNALRKH